VIRYEPTRDTVRLRNGIVKSVQGATVTVTLDGVDVAGVAILATITPAAGMVVVVAETSFALLVLGSYTAPTVPAGEPAGQVIAWTGTAAPTGWVLCDGATYTSATYPELYAVIGRMFTAAGVPAGSFQVPDLGGRFPLGANATYTAGSTGGAATHTLNVTEIPGHTHPTSSGSFVLYNGSTGSASGSTGGSLLYTSNVTGSAGGGGAHNNMPPYLAIRYIIRTVPGTGGGGGGSTPAALTVTDTTTLDLTLTGTGTQASPWVLKGDVLGGVGSGSLNVVDTTSINLTLTGAGTQASPWSLKGDVLSTGTAGEPAGQIIEWGGASLPSGWLWCNGGTYLQSAYPQLYAAIGRTYTASGVAADSFQVPDLSGRVPVGAGTYALGTKGGAASHVLTEAEMPSHVHGALSGTYVMFDGSTGTQAGSATGSPLYTHTSTAAAGSGQAHNNMPPYTAVHFIIRYASGTGSSAVVVPGPQGQTGPTGPAGTNGATGPPGTTTWAGITGKPTSYPNDQVTLATPTASGGRLVAWSVAGTLQSTPPTQAQDLATKGYVDSTLEGGSSRYAQGPTWDAYTRQAGNNRFTVWMDDSLQFGRATSSRRYKQDERPWGLDVAALLDVEPKTFHRTADPPGERDVGAIAEDLDDLGLTDLVDYDDQGRPDGIKEHRVVWALLVALREQASRIDDLERMMTTRGAPDA
jgi:microcystin-dependent protein